jgi:hypothetical protein
MEIVNAYISRSEPSRLLVNLYAFVLICIVWARGVCGRLPGAELTAKSGDLSFCRLNLRGYPAANVANISIVALISE